MLVEPTRRGIFKARTHNRLIKTIQPTTKRLEIPEKSKGDTQKLGGSNRLCNTVAPQENT